MKIGKLALDTVERTVEEVDAGLLHLTGLCAREMHAALAYPQLAYVLASALIPFLAEPFERHALAEAIDKAGADELRGKVRELYAAMLPAETPQEWPVADKPADGEDGASAEEAA